MRIDHEELLRRYIRWVGECEGVNYVDSGTWYDDEKAYFTPEGWAELLRLAKAPASTGDSRE